MIKVLHLIPSFGPGGAERQLSLVAALQSKVGLEVHVAYCSEGPNLTHIITSGVSLHHLPSSGNHDPVLAWKIFRLVRQVRPDIVQTWLLQMDILGGVAAMLNSVPFILSERSSGSLYLPSWKSRLRLVIGRKANCIVANSEGGLDYWRPYASAKRLELVRNCVCPSNDQNDSVGTPFPYMGGRPIVLFAGRFSHEKNIPVLLESLILVAQQHREVAIVLFGEGPEQAFAMQRIANAGLSERIVIRGYTSTLAAWMRRASVCVSVSHFEGNPNVALEAAAAGCPLVLSDIAAHREVFDEESAWLVPKDSPEIIAKGVLDALNNREKSIARAARALVLVSGRTPEVVARAYKLIYEQLLGKSNRS